MMVYLVLLVSVGLLPMAGLIWFLVSRHAFKPGRLVLTSLICAAFYLPFDIAATRYGVWSFGPTFLGKIGPVPVEEVLFYFCLFPNVALVYESLAQKR